MTAFRLGLTGSIGMGKSTTAAMFRDAGLPVWDADAAVHRLYAKDGAAVAPMGAIFPEAITDQGVDRMALKSRISTDPDALKKIEAIVHPLVTAERAEFAAKTVSDIVIFDIPLLFENAYDNQMNATLLVTASPDVQRARVLARPGMTLQQFNLILSRQMPDHQKRSRATHIVESLSFDQTSAYVLALIAHIRGGLHA